MRSTPSRGKSPQMVSIHLIWTSERSDTGSMQSWDQFRQWTRPEYILTRSLRRKNSLHSPWSNARAMELIQTMKCLEHSESSVIPSRSPDLTDSSRRKSDSSVSEYSSRRTRERISRSDLHRQSTWNPQRGSWQLTRSRWSRQRELSSQSRQLSRQSQTQTLSQLQSQRHTLSRQQLQKSSSPHSLHLLQMLHSQRLLLTADSDSVTISRRPHRQLQRTWKTGPLHSRTAWRKDSDLSETLRQNLQRRDQKGLSNSLKCSRRRLFEMRIWTRLARHVSSRSLSKI